MNIMNPNVFIAQILGSSLKFKFVQGKRHQHFQSTMVYRIGYAALAEQFTNQGILKGEVHYTIDLLFDWFGSVCFTNKNRNYQLPYSWFQTSQTGGQQYNDTSPSSIPWTNDLKFVQGILKGEVPLYGWPPVWLVWNQLYNNWQVLFLFAKQTNPNQSNRRSTVQW